MTSVPTWLLYIALGLLLLVAVARPINEWFKYDLHNGTPRAYFHSAAAYADCASMAAAANAQGAKYWTCYPPDQ